MFLLVFILTFYACKVTKSLTSTVPLHQNPRNAVEVSNPSSTLSPLEQSADWESTMKTAWPMIGELFGNMLNNIPFYYGSFSKQGINLTAGDIPKLKYVPVPVYQIDSSALRSFNTQTSLSTTLKLCKTMGTFVVCKGDTIIAEFFCWYKNGKWYNKEGFSVLDAANSEYISNLLSNKKPYYEVCVIGYPSKRVKIYQEYMITAENNEWMLAAPFIKPPITLAKALTDLSKSFNDLIKEASIDKKK